MKLAKRLWLAIILVLAIVTVPLSIPVVAGPSQTHEDKVELLKELWGKDMTLGEVLERVFPEALEGRTNEELEVLHSFKMIWPDPLAEYPESTEREVGAAFPILVHDSVSIDPNWPWIDYSASSRVWLPHPWYRLPYMSAFAYLYYYPNNLRGVAFDDGYDVYEVSAEGSYYTGTSGYYKTLGVFYSEYPPGSDPPTHSGSLSTSWVYVSP